MTDANALEWYREQAEALARHNETKNHNAMLAIVTTLSLDAGRRAEKALDASKYYTRAAAMLETIRDLIGHGYGEGDIEHITSITVARLEDWDRRTRYNSAVSYVLTEQLMSAIDEAAKRPTTIGALMKLHAELDRERCVDDKPSDLFACITDEEFKAEARRRVTRFSPDEFMTDLQSNDRAKLDTLRNAIVTAKLADIGNTALIELASLCDKLDSITGHKPAQAVAVNTSTYGREPGK